MSKSLIAAVAATASLLATGAAHAGNVYWSIGISAPPIGTVISNAPPVYAPPPVVYAPPPVVYAPAPVVYVPPPPPRVVYRPAPVVYGPPVVYRPVPVGYHGAWGDRDRDGIPNAYDRYDNRWGHRDGYRDRGDWDRGERKFRH